MLRKLLLAGAFALASAPAFADFTIRVPSGSEGDGLRAAAAEDSAEKGINVEIEQAP